MKTLNYSPVALLVFMPLLIFMSCKNEKKINMEEKITKNELKHILIPKEEAINMRRDFVQNQYQYINKGLKENYELAHDDYTHFTINLEDLKNYIKYAEALAKKENYSDLGFRIKLAAKRDAKTNVPYANMYYHLIGTKNKAPSTQKGSMLPLYKTPSPFYFSESDVSGTYGDRVRYGGNPPKLY